MEDLSNLAVALIALLSNVAGFFASNKLLNFRITKLEETVKERAQEIEMVHDMAKDIEFIKGTIEKNGGRIDRLENREN